MANLSNRNTSNSDTQPNTTTEQTNYDPKTDPNSFYRSVVGTFSAGDVVLFPAIGNGIYKLESIADPDVIRLAIRVNRGLYSFNRDGLNQPSDALPLIFHDTPANRQAVTTLYGVTYPPSDTSDGHIPSTNHLRPLTRQSLALDLEDTLNLKLQQMSWLNSLFTVVSYFSSHATVPQPMIDDLIAIGQHLTMNFEMDTDEAIDQCKQAMEVTA